MDPNKSLDVVKLVAALLHDFHKSHGAVFNSRSLRQTLNKVCKRLGNEGFGFLTKTLPRLGKAFDKALSGCEPLNARKLGFDALPNSELPRFLGEFFQRVLRKDGVLLQEPCIESVRILRQFLYLFYKYELPYSDEQEQQVLLKFEKTEEDLSVLSQDFELLEALYEKSTSTRRNRDIPTTRVQVLREAKILLSRLFAFFDPRDIYPRHGPGAVATKQKLSGKYRWTNVSRRITDCYPFDEFYCSSIGAVCDHYLDFQSISEEDLPARVILVPKDSRGPRLISCEPVDFQWVQQGLGRAITELVESHELTKFNVHFTDQQPNRFGALLGSETGRYATLDLNEASDRVSVDLVRLLFPSHVYTYLSACRSLSTVLPSGKELKLKKFAPMGSCLCFPIMALTIWSILTAGTRDADTRESILVYGDDVIVPTAYAARAVELLESFGLKINRDKSCTSGLFRESCGMDAFNGADVTPVRLRTVWSSLPSPESYESWISYANSFFDRKCFATYEFIVGELLRLYGPIPGKDMNLSCPSLAETPVDQRPIRSRWNKRYQKREFFVLVSKSPSVIQELPGWSKLLRFFTEKVGRPRVLTDDISRGEYFLYRNYSPFSVSQYTSPRTSMLVRRWR